MNMKPSSPLMPGLALAVGLSLAGAVAPPAVAAVPTDGSRVEVAATTLADLQVWYAERYEKVQAAMRATSMKESITAPFLGGQPVTYTTGYNLNTGAMTTQIFGKFQCQKKDVCWKYDSTKKKWVRLAKGSVKVETGNGADFLENGVETSDITISGDSATFTMTDLDNPDITYAATVIFTDKSFFMRLIRTNADGGEDATSALTVRSSALSRPLAIKAPARKDVAKGKPVTGTKVTVGLF